MPKFYGKVGYSEETVESPDGSGNWVPQIIERMYTGDVLKNRRRLEENPDKQNKDISVQHSISIMADEYSNEHISTIRYVEWAGALWTVDSVTVERPRLLLSLGDIYSGPVPIVDEEEDP